jgi:NAD(P) transhydrogenase
MARYDFDILVVGSGPGGQSAALQAAALGKRTGLIERKPRLGGVSLQTGTIPSKALREAAWLTSRFAARGMREATISRGPVKGGSLGETISRKQRIIENQATLLLQQLMAAGVTLIPGEASFHDAHTLNILRPDGARDRLSADIIVLATGSRPRRPENVPFDRERVLDSTSILQLRRLPERLLVIGGGVIACEFATMFAPLGVSVRLVDSHRHLLAYLDEDILKILESDLSEMGIQLHMETRVNDITRVDDRVVVATSQGGKLEADVLLYAQGREPNYDRLELERADLVADDHGWVRINEQHQTSQSHIYIIGDLAGRPSLAATAMEQGRLVVQHAFAAKRLLPAGHLPMAIYTIPELSWTGETERRLQERGTDYVVGRAHFSETARGQIIGEEHGFMKVLAATASRELLGIHIIGESASELIHVGQMAMNCGATVDTLAACVYNYPTLAECYKTAALDCLRQLPA